MCSRSSFLTQLALIRKKIGDVYCLFPDIRSQIFVVFINVLELWESFNDVDIVLEVNDNIFRPHM